MKSDIRKTKERKREKLQQIIAEQGGSVVVKGTGKERKGRIREKYKMEGRLEKIMKKDEEKEKKCVLVEIEV